MGPLLNYLVALGTNPSSSERFAKGNFWHPPSESEDITTFAAEEGRGISVLVNKYERSLTNRTACIRALGAWCRVCGFDFAKTYGEIGEGYIHVHHLATLASLEGKARKFNPVMDMVPVCPNCHEMLHRNDPPYTIQQLKEILSKATSIAVNRLKQTKQN